MLNILPTKRNISSKKVYVGMSGGVDSSVSALLLKQAGYDVTGVFIKVWQPEEGDCGWKDERRDAMRVAAKIDIPFLTFDFSEKYKKEVVDYMIDEYKAGRTPNPDVMCNKHVKFGSFLAEALTRSIDYVATGHYAQNILITNQNNSSNNYNNFYSLKEGKDKNKDQSYFLWTLRQDDLKHILFPIGHLQKDEVRKIAKMNDLPVFDKKDSQGVCFIGHLDMKAFLKEYIKTSKGNVCDINGKIVGEHDGACIYTVGERHGFTIFNKGEEGTHNQKHYIISKDIPNNIITVADESAIKDKLESYAPSRVKLLKLNWIGPTFISNKNNLAKKYGARIRYRQELQVCQIDLEDEEVWLTFDKPQKGMAEGQSAVIYDGETCLGGGILDSII